MCRTQAGCLTFGCALLTMSLHRHMCIQMVQCPVRLFAPIPTALVHSLDLFISPARSLVLLRTRDGYERINGRKWMAALSMISDRASEPHVSRVAYRWRSWYCVRDHAGWSSACRRWRMLIHGLLVLSRPVWPPVRHRLTRILRRHLMLRWVG